MLTKDDGADNGDALLLDFYNLWLLCVACNSLKGTEQVIGTVVFKRKG